jgi:hypothetical protein
LVVVVDGVSGVSGVSDASGLGDEVPLSGMLKSDDSGREEPFFSEPVSVLVFSVSVPVVMLLLTLPVLLGTLSLSLTLVTPKPRPPVVGKDPDNSVCVAVIVEVLGRV